MSSCGLVSICVKLRIPCRTELFSAAVSIAGIICEKYKVLCESGSYNVHFAKVYLDAIDFVSIRWERRLLHSMLVPQHSQCCFVWANPLLRAHERGAERPSSAVQILVHQVDRDVHVLPILRGKPVAFFYLSIHLTSLRSSALWRAV